MKPIILITNKFEVDTIPFGVGPICAIRSNYCNSIREAGGTPLITALGDAEEYAKLTSSIPTIYLKYPSIKNAAITVNKIPPKI